MPKDQEEEIRLVAKHKAPPPLGRGNTKLGSIWNFSLPAMITCPGSTEACEGPCYACGGFYNMPNVMNRLDINDAMRDLANFTSRVTAQIRVCGVQYCRVHVAGDFDQVKYSRKWPEIVTRQPRTQFWAYTRSWSEMATERAGEDLLPELLLLGKMPNFEMWFSCDKDTGRPPKRRGFRHAYMTLHDDDVPEYKPDLYFRVSRMSRMTQIDGTLVCPEERQAYKKGDRRLTCAECRLCFDRPEWIDQKNKAYRLPVLTA